MSTKKIFVGLFLTLFSISFLSSQSLVKLAKKEKERRSKYKAKKHVVITNADLLRLKRKPAVLVPKKSALPEESQKETILPEQSSVPEAETSGIEKEDAENLEARVKELEIKWTKAQEFVALFNLKMNALWQEYHNLDDMTSREKIQKEISQTYLKLQQAQQEEVKAKQELEDAHRQLRKKSQS
jgi:hypothetical protein